MTKAQAAALMLDYESAVCTGVGLDEVRSKVLRALSTNKRDAERELRAEVDKLKQGVTFAKERKHY